jgi:hypothetical protein
MSSTTQLESLKRQNERLKEDLERKRIKTSEAVADLVAFCEKTDEPFNPKNEKSSHNPYKVKSSGCTVV